MAVNLLIGLVNHICMVKEFKSQVTKFTGKRKIIEVIAAARDDFEIGDSVQVKKIKEEK